MMNTKDFAALLGKGSVDDESAYGSSWTSAESLPPNPNGFSLNPFSDISVEGMEHKTFVQKCKDTFFVFLGNKQKLGLFSSGTILLLPLSPLLLFLGPLLYMIDQVRMREEGKTPPEYSVWAWIAAGLWASPAIVVLAGLAVGLGAVGAGIIMGLAAAAVGILLGVLGLVVGLAVAAIPVGIVLAPIYPLYMLLEDEKKKYPLWLKICAGLVALPSITILIALALAVGVAALGLLIAAAVTLVAIVLAAAAAALALAIALPIASFVATLVSVPFIAVVHAIWGPAETKTPVRRSLLLNPSTWVMSAISVAGISLLIQGVDPLAFGSAAGPLLIMQTVFAGLACTMVLAGLMYMTYRAGRWIYSQYDDEVSEKNNYITKYLSERWDWAKNNKTTAGVIWGIGAVGLLVVLGLTIDYLTGGVLFGSVMAPVFNFMSQGFLSSFHAVAGLPGLEFLGSASEAAILLGGQILTAITLISMTIFVTDSVSRLFETASEFIKNRENRVTYEHVYGGHHFSEQHEVDSSDDLDENASYKNKVLRSAHTAHKGSSDSENDGTNEKQQSQSMKQSSSSSSSD